jgi:hypothetical protein
VQATLMFQQQGAFYNAVTMGNSTNQIVAALSSLVAANMPGISASAFANGIADPNLNENTRISWKYSASRYTTGTPNVMVNQLQQEQIDETWTLQDWQALLDPLFQGADSAGRAAAWRAKHHRS